MVVSSVCNVELLDDQKEEVREDELLEGSILDASAASSSWNVVYVRWKSWCIVVRLEVPVSAHGPRRTVKVGRVSRIFCGFAPIPVRLVSFIIALISEGFLECPSVVPMPG